MEPFPSPQPYCVGTHTYKRISKDTLFHAHLLIPRCEKLSSNLYDGLNNYCAFSAQFVDESGLIGVGDIYRRRDRDHFINSWISQFYTTVVEYLCSSSSPL